MLNKCYFSVKSRLLTVMLLCLISLFTTKAFSQDPPPICLMDCPDSPWIYETISIPLNTICQDVLPGCTLEVSFWYRHAQCTTGMNEIVDAYDCQIEEMFYWQQCYSTCMANKGIAEIYRVALQHIHDWVRVFYSIQTEDYIWRGVNIPCWGRLSVNGKEVIKYCPDEHPQCCWKKYLVINSGNSYTYNLVDAYIPFGAPSKCYISTYPCTYICDKDSLFDPPPPPTQNPSTVEQLSNNISSYDNLIIKLDNFSDIGYMKIYDILGNIIVNIALDKNGLKNKSMNLKTGVYFYQITNSKNIIIDKGKLILN